MLIKVFICVDRATLQTIFIECGILSAFAVSLKHMVVNIFCHTQYFPVSHSQTIAKSLSHDRLLHLPWQLCYMSLIPEIHLSDNVYFTRAWHSCNSSPLDGLVIFVVSCYILLLLLLLMVILFQDHQKTDIHIRRHCITYHLFS